MKKKSKLVLSRKTLFRFERLVNKLVKKIDWPYNVIFSPGDDGLKLIAVCSGATLCMTVPDVNFTKAFYMPWNSLKELIQLKTGDAEFEQTDKNTVTASWTNRGIPYHCSCELSKDTEKLPPPLPNKTTTHTRQLFDIMAAAGKYASKDDSRHPALPGLCLRGDTGRIYASDSMQAIRYDGFKFPWKDHVICPVSAIFQSREIRENSDKVTLGLVEKLVCFQVGDVTFWLRSIDAKYPIRLFDEITQKNTDRTWVHLDPDDIQFALERIDYLPTKPKELKYGCVDTSKPVQILCDDAIRIRGYDVTNKSAVELQLVRSRYEGKEVIVDTNRDYLRNALSLGVNRIGFSFDDIDGAILGYTESLVIFLWMPLDSFKDLQLDEGKLTILKSDDIKAQIKEQAERILAKKKAKAK